MIQRKIKSIVKLSLLYSFILIGLLGFKSSAQTPLNDVIYLKNGSVIKGVIVEMIPNQSVRIKTTDGSIFVYKMEDVEKIIKEEEARDINKKKDADDNSGTGKGVYVGIHIEPGISYYNLGSMLFANGGTIGTFTPGAVINLTSVGLSIALYPVDKVGFTSGLNIQRYGVNLITNKSYLTYLTVPLLVSVATGRPKHVGFYFDAGPQLGILLGGSLKESSMGESHPITKSFQIFANVSAGVNLPLISSKLSLQIGPYFNMGLLNDLNKYYSLSDKSHSYAGGVAFHLKYNLTK